ncbi:hypothetical protein DIJ62_27825 [Burkholderia pseudomallei]|nr:hypothetical protein DIJ62_27825 [Burkholderia pseudomallei]
MLIGGLLPCDARADCDSERGAARPPGGALRGNRRARRVRRGRRSTIRSYRDRARARIRKTPMPGQAAPGETGRMNGSCVRTGQGESVTRIARLPRGRRKRTSRHPRRRTS